MNVFRYFREVVVKAIEELSAAGKLPSGLDLRGVSVEPPREAAHGDIACNAALVLAKQAKAKPRDIAVALAELLAAEPAVSEVEVAGPGFINLRLATAFWYERLADVLIAGTDYGASNVGAGEKINVEYVSVNPTGPLHVGHGRGAVVGDALASLLAKAGYDVTREYYINDAGRQVDALAQSVYHRYREALGEQVGDLGPEMYPGDYLKEVGKKLAQERGRDLLSMPEFTETNQLGWGVGGWREECANFGCDAMMELIRSDLAALGIEHDVFISERKLVQDGKIEHALGVLEEKGLIYTGILEPPKGKKPEDWEPRPQVLFRATEFGDDVDRPLKKSDGSWTYFAGDLANHLHKYERGFNTMINVWGADHGGYVKRMKAAVAALSDQQAELDIKLCQMVNLLEDGVPVKMSKRAGSFVTLRQVVDQVGKDVVRFIMLTRRNDAPLDFDFARVTEQSKDNPVFYVQYAHARAYSVLRNAVRDLPQLDASPAALAKAELGRLAHEDELALIRTVAGWPRLVETAAQAHEPHRVAFYLYDLASAFHALWNRGNEDPTLRFIIVDDPELTAARLALVRGVATVVASGLEVFGVEPVEEMR
jgi:arginyl-tRNA synthetase